MGRLTKSWSNLRAIVIILSLFSLGGFAPQPIPLAHAAQNLPAIDGAPAFNSCSSSTTCVATLTTTAAYDIVVIVTSAPAGSGTPIITDSLGLFWTRRSPSSIGQTNFLLFYFFAPSQSFILGSDAITATWGAATSPDIAAFAVSNINYAESTGPGNLGWDYGWISTRTAGTNSAPSKTITTSHPNDLVFSIVSNATQAPKLGPGSGFTELAGTVHTPDIQYRVVSAAQPGTNIAWAGGSLGSWTMYVDALEGIDSAGGPAYGPIVNDGSVIYDTATTTKEIVYVHTTMSNDLLVAFASVADVGLITMSLGASGNSPVAGQWMKRYNVFTNCNAGVGKEVLSEWVATSGPPGTYSINVTVPNLNSFQTRLFAINGAAAALYGDYPNPSWSCQVTGSPNTSPSLVFPGIHHGLVVAYADAADIGSGQTNCGGSNFQEQPGPGFTAIPLNLLPGSSGYPGVENGGGGEYQLLPNEVTGTYTVSFVCNSTGWWMAAELFYYPSSSPAAAVANAIPVLILSTLMGMMIVIPASAFLYANKPSSAITVAIVFMMVVSIVLIFAMMPVLLSLLTGVQ